MSAYSEFKEDSETLTSAKPADLDIEGVSASVQLNARVIGSFDTANETSLQALRDWLISLVGNA